MRTLVDDLRQRAIQRDQRHGEPNARLGSAGNTPQCPTARRRPPIPAKSSTNPTDPLQLGVACRSSCTATRPCAVNEDVRETPSPNIEASVATASVLTLARRSDTRTGKDKIARRTSPTIDSDRSARWARTPSGWIQSQELQKIEESCRRNSKARTHRPPTICPWTMVRGSSWQTTTTKQ